MTRGRSLDARLPLALALALGCADRPPSQPRDHATTTRPALDAGLGSPDPLARSAVETFVGLVVAGESVDISARRAGRLDRILVRLGQRVTANSLLATLDARSAHQDLLMAAATAGGAQAAVQKATVDLNEARERLARLERLGESFVSKEERSAADFRVQAAVSQLASSQASLREQDARQAQLSDSVADTKLRAPFAGKVAALFLDAGAVVSAGTPIVRLISDGELTVRFAVPAEHAASVKPSTPIVVVSDPPGEPLRGLVATVSPEVDSSSGMLFAEAHLGRSSAGTARLPAGSVVRVRLLEPGASP